MRFGSGTSRTSRRFVGRSAWRSLYTFNVRPSPYSDDLPVTTSAKASNRVAFGILITLHRRLAATLGVLAAASCGSSGGESSVAIEGEVTTLTTAPAGTPLDRAARNGLWLCPRLGLPPVPPLAASSASWVEGTVVGLGAIPYVEGSARWQSQLSLTQTDTARVLKGNGLPNHPTGTFPVQKGTSAHPYYSTLPAEGYSSAAEIPIAAYDIDLALPREPQANSEPTCVHWIFQGLVTQTGAAWHADVAPDSSFQLHDPVTALPLDRCFGHPYAAQYHYHAYSWKCFPNQGEAGEHSPLFGYAIDGFGVFGPRGESGKPVTNAELDECHGHTHEIEWDGENRVMYHYHVNTEYPYSIGCYRGTPIELPHHLQH
jgi:hypothetical protein